MPVLATVSVSTIVEKISDLDLFELFGKNIGELKPRTNPIWDEACLKLENLIKVDNLFLRVKQNRGNLLVKIKEKRGISTLDITTGIFHNDSIEISVETVKTEDGSFIQKNQYHCPDLLYDVEIDTKTWERIQPESVIYEEKRRFGNTRRYSVLQKGWTDVLHKLCWEKTKLPCAYSFKRAKVYDRQNEVYIKINGKCNECGSVFTGHCLKKTKSGQNVKISITTSDTRGVPHKKRRQLKGNIREEVQEELMHQKAAAWRCDATKMMDYGDDAPPHVYTNEVLRKARQEGKDKALGLHNVHDVITSLQTLKYNIEFSGTIREIALDKFYIKYWTAMQLDLYKDLIKSGIPLTIDATGSVVQRFRRSNGDSGAIFLYQAVMQGQVGIFPVCQILSEKHDTNMIAYWLKEWLRCGAVIPKETVTDFSLALLNGVSLAFNECSLKTYIQTCTQCLSVEKNSSIPPNCFIRVDIAHTIKMVTRWKCFNGKPVKIKDFYLRGIGVMTTCISKKEFESTISALLIVALCEANDTRSECGSRQKFLLDSIRTFSIKETDTNLDDHELNDLFESLHQKSSRGLPNFGSIKSYAKSVAEESWKLERPNPYYLPEIVTPFLRLCQYFPLWTNIMSMTSRTKYNSASSARSETYFNNLKNKTLNDEDKPLRADKFLIKHIRSITGLCKLERAAYNAHLNLADTSSSSEPDDFPDIKTVTRSDDHLDELSTAVMYRTEQLDVTCNSNKKKRSILK